MHTRRHERLHVRVGPVPHVALLALVLATGLDGHLRWLGGGGGKQARKVTPCGYDNTLLWVGQKG